MGEGSSIEILRGVPLFAWSLRADTLIKTLGRWEQRKVLAGAVNMQMRGYRVGSKKRILTKSLLFLTLLILLPSVHILHYHII